MSMTTDNSICQAGIPMAILAGITIGENSGNREDQNAKVLFGFWMTAIMIYKARITGIVIGSVNVWLSAISSPIADPTAANMEE